jgi:hypothetical protein
METDNMNIIKEILSLKRDHYYCEDCWHSCPKEEDGCCNPDKGDECDCGADEQNAKIDAIVEELRRRGIVEENQANVQLNEKFAALKCVCETETAQDDGDLPENMAMELGSLDMTMEEKAVNINLLIKILENLVLTRKDKALHNKINWLKNYLVSFNVKP